MPSDYSKILNEVKERPDSGMIQTMMLRSMSQAIYSPDNKGHFGLAYDAYTHFTSPIRRYPDLLVHRAIKHILKHGKPQPMENYFTQAGEHCSMTERRADDATSEVTDWLKCEFMMDKVGQEFAGRVSGVTSFGIFVELIDIYVEGLVHISTLPEDYYQFDPIHHVLFGDRTGQRYQIGSEVKIQVARVDLDKCEIDFVLAGMPLNGRKSSRPRDDEEGKRKSRAVKSLADQGAAVSQAVAANAAKNQVRKRKNAEDRI